MTPEERSLVVAKGEKCKSRGCQCRARCYRCWNKYWLSKADICTHPNFLPPDTEWHGDQPPLVGNKSKPRSINLQMNGSPR